MSQTLVEQIISHAVGHSVHAGDLVVVPVDVANAEDLGGRGDRELLPDPPPVPRGRSRQHQPA
jgi:homoaconitase/3-isopropylmalate dehydratase large subunit